jgi:hypothetical protein
MVNTTMMRGAVFILPCFTKTPHGKAMRSFSEIEKSCFAKATQDHHASLKLLMAKPCKALAKHGGGGGDRTRVRKFSTVGSTCLALSLV